MNSVLFDNLHRGEEELRTNCKATQIWQLVEEKNETKANESKKINTQKAHTNQIMIRLSQNKFHL